MSIFTPSTTPTTRQVWPATPKPAKPPIVQVPREDRTSVALDNVKVGDTLSFLSRDGVTGMVERVGTVVQVEFGAFVKVQTERGRCVLTRFNWEQRAPRR